MKQISPADDAGRADRPARKDGAVLEDEVCRGASGLQTLRVVCIIRNYMAYTAIVGASGYSGQETLDRVLAHPELDLFALGSDSLAGQAASALDPRLARNGARRAPAFVTNEEALASGADLVFVCLDHERAAALEPPVARRGRRPLRRAPAARTAASTTSGTASPIRASRELDGWSLRDPGALAAGRRG